MGLMQKLRSGTKYTIWILIISFGVLWVLADTQVFDAVMVGPRAMGEVNRESITYAEFNERVSNYSERYREQTGEAPTMEMRAQYENMVWDELVLDKLLKQKMEDLGLAVTDTELMEMVTGDNPDPFIRQQFQREDGTIDRAALQNAISAPENAQIWVMIEQQLREQRRQQKLSNLIETSVYVSDYEINQEYRRANSRATFRYLRFPFSDVSDDEVEISDSEVRSYYRANQDRFKREKTWRFSYVTFSKDATADDTLRTIDRMRQLSERFETATNDSIFLLQNRSETRYYSNFLSPNDVRVEHLPAFDLQPGNVSEPYVHGGKVHVLKMLEQRPAGQNYTRVRQIVLNVTSSNRAQKEAQANSIIQELNEGASFARMVEVYSEDRSSKANGGEIGYLSRDDKDAAIINPVFRASVGSFIGPIEHENKLHIFEIVSRTNQDIRFADLSRTVEADAMETVEKMASDADDFAFYAREDGFATEAERAGLQVEEAIATEGNPFISGLGQSQIILNAVKEMRRGRISDVIETDDSFIVLRVDNITSAGVRPLDEVRQQIEPLVRTEKRKEFLTQRVAQLRDQFTDIDAMAEAEGKTVRRVEDIRMNASNISGAGREPMIVGAVFGLDAQVLSKPIAGDNGVFIIYVEEHNMADPSQMSSSDRRQISDRLQQSRNEAFGQVWVDRLKHGARIQDHRRLHTAQ